MLITNTNNNIVLSPTGSHPALPTRVSQPPRADLGEASSGVEKA